MSAKSQKKKSDGREESQAEKPEGRGDQCKCVNSTESHRVWIGEHVGDGCNKRRSKSRGHKSYKIQPGLFLL